MRVSRKRLWITGALLWGTAAANAQSRPALVELFTSEGCSSCPPAEAYLGELARRPDVLALTFHVDYWDDLGWRDRFGLPESVQRQRGYASALRLSSIYTPQVVIDGQDDFVGSDRVRIERALALPRSGVAISISVASGGVSIDLADQPGVAPSDIVLVAYQRAAVSPIGRGENAGRTIQEFNIVRALRRLGRWQGQSQRFQARIDSLPPESTDVAILVQPIGQAPIIGAARAPLR